MALAIHFTLEYARQDEYALVFTVYHLRNKPPKLKPEALKLLVDENQVWYGITHLLCICNQLEEKSFGKEKS